MRYQWLLSALVLLAFGVPAGAQRVAGARLNGLKVLSNHVDDVTTPEAILKSFIKPGMTDEERARALWTCVVRYRHQTAPPNEYLAADWEAHDPVKLFNVYGYCMCCCCSAMVEALNRMDGREARGRILNGHSVPEVRYGGGWHMYDASLINYFPKPDGRAASVDEISEAVTSWLNSHDGYRGNGGKLLQLMQADGWTGWKSQGPALLAANPFYHSGMWPANTHGWNATMVEYDKPRPNYDYGYQAGHRALLSLRPGESFERDAGNHGLHVNMESDPGFVNLKSRAPEEDLVYLKQFMPGYNGGVVGNGYHRYAPNLAKGDLARGAEQYDNLAGDGTPALHVKAAGKPGVAVVPMTSPYVYLGGRVHIKAVRRTAADSVVLALSTNNGRSYKEIWSAPTVGVSEARVELGARILRRYAYSLKVEIRSNSGQGTGVAALEIENDIQHAPRTLAWLAGGDNTITVSADGDPAVATRSIACRITPDAAFDKNESTTTMGAVFENVDVQDNGAWWKGGTGRMTLPIRTPGDIVDIRFSAHMRVRDVKDTVRMLVSFDAGKTWSEAQVIHGPTPGIAGYFRFDKVPVGKREALFRFEMTGVNTVGVESFRIDTDYRDPLAAKTARPIVVTHRWTEDGQLKSKAVTVTRLPHTYHIAAGGEPRMVSVTCDMPATP